MAAIDALPDPIKNKLYRLYFAMRDTSNAAITATWTGSQCTVLLDGASAGTATVVQVTGTQWGYVELSAAQMNGSAACISISITNTNARPVDLVIYPHDLSHVAASAAPTNMDAMFRQLWERQHGKVVNTGDFLKVMGPDGVTSYATMAITSNPLTKEKSY